jgi:predicted RNA polymerase sigma factor
MSDPAAQRAVEAVWRIESARLIAGLARLVRDVGLAEDLAQDALVAALEHWPESGVPENPGAWLMTTARNRAVNLARRNQTFARKREELMHEAGIQFAFERSDLEAEIARAFLAPEKTVAQRLVRAKRTLRDARVPLEVPRGEELRTRLPSVLETIYLVFNDGYAASAGEDLIRHELCEESLRLGRILAELAPEEPEAHGLIALLEIQASRARARVGSDGEPVLLLEQDRSRWDPLLIVRGRRALERAEALPGPLGPYGLQAAIAAQRPRRPARQARPRRRGRRRAPPRRRDDRQPAPARAAAQAGGALRERLSASIPSRSSRSIVQSSSWVAPSSA